jgi:transposase
MPAERLPMRQVREVLRLKYLSGHRIAVVVGISRYTVAEYLRRAAVVGISWPVPSDLDDTALEQAVHAARRDGAFLGGVTRQVVCDNLKAGVTAACRYDPVINRSYADMATHYGTAIVPTRVRKPHDKAKVEVAVQLVQRWVLARLRHRRFFSLAELNGAIGELIEVLNTRAMRHLGSSRRALFEATERSALLQCRRSHTSTLNGAAAARASTTTSRCMDTGIPCHPG